MMNPVLICLVACMLVFTQDQRPRVIIHGTLRGIMGHDISPKISLQKVPDMEHIYGLGAAGDLQGEILILDDQTYWSHVEDNEVVTSTSRKADASLLVYTSVGSWRTEILPIPVKTSKDLEATLAQYRNSEPFAFIIRDNPESIQWHVLDWNKSDSVHTHEKHKQSGISKIETNPGEVTILGFYSTRHKGIFTHHSTTIHMHALINGHAAHVDNIEFSENMELQLPDYIQVKSKK